jgi:protein-tyrosine-phosphatase
MTEKISATEQSSIHKRAARHAALADPIRLRIVDLLALTDASPAELESILDVRSNLLAHHLKQLEDVGIIARHRSEADRRRTYVSLVPGALDGLTPSQALRVPRVVFVCTGNSARSQLAAALWNARSDVPVASGGTRPAARIEPGALAAARRHGIAIEDASPRALAEVLRDDDLVVTVCDSAHEQLSPPGALHWSVPDPVPSGSQAAFDAAFEELAQRITALAPHVQPATSTR